MELLDYKSRNPIYEQIVVGFKKMILSGVYKKDDQLPTVRQLAQELAINPNTIQKAYAELERQGITYSVKGKGSFVNLQSEAMQSVRKQELLLVFCDTAGELRNTGAKKSELTEFIEQIFVKGEKGQ